MSATLDRDGVLLLNTKRCETWTNDDRKHLNRAAKVMNTHGDKFRLVCGSPICPDSLMKLTQDDTDPSGAILECGCTRRIFTRSC